MDKSNNNPPNRQGTIDARRKAMEEAVKRARASQAPGQRDAYSEDEDTGGDPEHSRTVKMARVEGQAFAERAVHTMKAWTHQRTHESRPRPRPRGRRGLALVAALRRDRPRLDRLFDRPVFALVSVPRAPQAQAERRSAGHPASCAADTFFVAPSRPPDSAAPKSPRGRLSPVPPSRSARANATPAAASLPRGADPAASQRVL